MSSLTEVIVEETGIAEESPKLEEFTRLEKMLLFAVVTECERCIASEGIDCLRRMHRIDCPFFSVRQEYKVDDIEVWREKVR